MSELNTANNSILEAALISVKWKRYRDTVYKLWTVNEPDDSKYKERMRLLQSIIKTYMAKHSVEIVDAVTAIVAAEDDARFGVQFLSAGYDLVGGDDYTLTPVVDAIGVAIVEPEDLGK